MAMVINGIDEIRSLVSSAGFKIYGIGGYPSTRTGLHSLIDDFEVICSEKTGEFDSVADKIKVKAFDLGKTPHPRKPSSILSSKGVVKYIKDNSDNRKVAIYVYAPDRKLCDICSKNDWIVIGNAPGIRDLVGNRFGFYEMLKKINWSAEDIIVTVDEFKKSTGYFFKIFGSRIVVQFDGLGGGKSTMFFSESEKNEMVERIKHRMSVFGVVSDKLVVKKFITGRQVSATGCITKKNGILTSVARNQLIDIPGLVPKNINAQGVFCGNDFSISQNFSKTVHDQAASFVEKIGEIMKNMGALGIFGVDFILDKSANKLVPLEINPRLLGTFPASVQISLGNNEVPLVAFHVLEFLEIDYRIANEKVYKNKNGNIQGAHLTMSNFFLKNVSFKKSLRGGVYKIEKEGIKFVKNGFEMQDIDNPEEEFIITDGVPIKGKIFRKGKKLLRIITREKVLSPESDTKLNSQANRIIKNVSKLLEKLVKYRKARKMKFLIVGAINSENTKDLVVQIKERGNDCHMVRPKDIVFNLHDGKIEIKDVTGVDLLSFEVVLLRGYNVSLNEVMIFSQVAKDRGRVVIDERVGLQGVRGKLSDGGKMIKAGLNYPNTFSILSGESFDAIKHKVTYPAILKPVFGRQGKGIEKIENEKKLFSFLKKNNRGWLIQEFLPIDGDVRVFVVGDTVLGAIKRLVIEGDYRSNASLGAKAEKFDIDVEMKEIALKAIQAVGDEIAGVDLAWANNKWYVFEVSSAPQWQKFKEVTGINPAKSIVEYAIKKAQKSTRINVRKK